MGLFKKLSEQRIIKSTVVGKWATGNVAIKEPEIDPSMSTEELIEQIHHEFEVHSDELLIEAKAILNNPIKKKEKMEALTDLGFSKNVEAKEYNQKLAKNNMSRIHAKNIRYYSKTYPDYKYITDDGITEICKKYNLVYGDVKLYNGFVPNDNVKEMLSFKDIPLKDRSFNEHSWSGFDFSSSDRQSDYASFREQERRNKSREQKIKNGDYLPIIYAGLGGSEISVETIKICAPVKDMDMTGMTLDKNQRVQKIHIPDPVVIMPVRGGGLIITAWGDESEDPLVKK